MISYGRHLQLQGKGIKSGRSYDKMFQKKNHYFFPIITIIITIIIYYYLANPSLIIIHNFSSNRQLA